MTDFKSFARDLRRRQSDAERILWSKIRARQLMGIKFRRQHPVGGYIVDFISLDYRLIIELDGGQHNEPAGAEKDLIRTQQLEKMGYRVIRFWDTDVIKNCEGVILTIENALQLGPRGWVVPPSP